MIVGYKCGHCSQDANIPMRSTCKHVCCLRCWLQVFQVIHVFASVCHVCHVSSVVLVVIDFYSASRSASNALNAPLRCEKMSFQS